MLKLRKGMQIDLGGIGKEYAVDSAADLVEKTAPGLSCLINFGGDVAVRHARENGKPWRVGIESCASMGAAERVVQLSRGALATSGDSRRFVSRGGHRYSHILDARTGWPVLNAPRSITVAADTCTQAGTLTTLAMLQGEHADCLHIQRPAVLAAVVLPKSSTRKSRCHAGVRAQTRVHAHTSQWSIYMTIILLVLLALIVLVMLASVCAFHLAVGNGRFEDLDSSSWAGLFGSAQCDGKQRNDD